MKKGITITAAILSFFIITVESNAETRIRPTGITSPDDLATVHLSGIFATRGLSPSPYGAIISGENSYSGNYYSCGGYFSASGRIGVGVHGEASYSGDSQNFGGYFEASSRAGIGVSGKCLGTNCMGVHGEASYSGESTNFGGYFEASSATGIGVSGRCLGTYGTGVDSLAPGTYGIGVRSSGGQWDFYAVGGQSGYGPFTGGHEVKFSKEMPEAIVPGLIVSTTGKTEARKNKSGKISLSSTLPTVTLSTKANDKAVFGVIVSNGPLPKDHWYESQEAENFGVVNALGEGRVWVTNRNGNIENGDYVTTSEIPGHGKMQDDDFLHSYTLGKAIETIDWDQVTKTVQHDGKTYKRYLIAVVYTSG